MRYDTYYQYSPYSFALIGLYMKGDVLEVEPRTGGRGWTFSNNAMGQPYRVSRIGAGTSNVTYHGCWPVKLCGRVHTYTNAMNQVTSFDDYDSNGRLRQMTDPLGVVTQINYDARGRVRTITQTPPAGQGNPRMTSYTYDGVGQLNTVSTPDGITLTYEYDAAHDLRSITDNLGNKITYSYDARGNESGEYVLDPDGTLIRTVDRIYDVRNFVESINAAGSITQFVNNTDGNPLTVTDPNLNSSTTHRYDDLGRLVETTDAFNNPISYTYDEHDRHSDVVAANGATTSYDRNEYGDIRIVSSGDHRRSSEFNIAGDVIWTYTSQDQLIRIDFEYDSLRRRTAVLTDVPEENVTFTYDTCVNGAGRLCGVTDQSGTTSFEYDVWGNVTRQIKNELGIDYITAYTYDDVDRVSSIIYPDGTQVTYLRDAVGHVSDVDVVSNGVTTRILSNRQYRADNLLAGQTFGNGLTETRLHDLQGRLDTQYLGALETRTYSYDANGNLTGQILPGNTTVFDYDALNRLVSELTGAGTDGYTYDPNGNRLTDASGSYTYEPGSNRIATMPDSSITYDPAGHITNIHGLILGYNQAGRLATISQPAKGNKPPKEVASMVYNAFSQRTHKITDTGTSVYHYDVDGNLILETTATGEFVARYIWVDSEPILFTGLAEVTTGKGKNRVTTLEEVSSYVHTDHLGTPRVATNDAQNVVWRWDEDAFGQTEPNEDPDGDGTVVPIKLRFPGQYADAETGFYYNWNRYYDPKTGRYITSDPIGLQGGTNTYLYANANPIKFIDPLGLQYVNFGGGYTGRIDSFNYKGESDFEIHIYDKNGNEVGVHGPKGWIPKHGHPPGPPDGVPESVCEQVKGTTIDELRNRDRFPPKGTVNIKGDFWKKFVKYGGSAAVVGNIHGNLSIERLCGMNPNHPAC